MSKIKNGGLDQYGAGPFEQQQFGAAGVEGVKTLLFSVFPRIVMYHAHLLEFYHLMSSVIHLYLVTCMPVK